MDEYLGIIKIFAGSFAPRGWAFCNGQLISIAQNSALFSLLGTTYGGDGIQTFALPDLRGRVPVHAGQGPGLSNYVLGERTGTENNTLTIANMPTHSHPVAATMSVSNENASQSAATSGASIATPGVPEGRDFNATFGFSTGAPNTPINGLNVNVGLSGGSQPINNVQPCLAINYIICIQGIYPSRD